MKNAFWTNRDWPLHAQFIIDLSDDVRARLSCKRINKLSLLFICNYCTINLSLYLLYYQSRELLSPWRGEMFRPLRYVDNHKTNTCVSSSGLPVGSRGIVGRRTQKSGHQLAASPYWMTSSGLASVTFHAKKPSFWAELQLSWDKREPNPCLVATSACLKLFRLIYYPFAFTIESRREYRNSSGQGEKR